MTHVAVVFVAFWLFYGFIFHAAMTVNDERPLNSWPLSIWLFVTLLGPITPFIFVTVSIWKQRPQY